jgi:hypothetical protein
MGAEMNETLLKILYLFGLLIMPSSMVHTLFCWKEHLDNEDKIGIIWGGFVFLGLIVVWFLYVTYVGGLFR